MELVPNSEQKTKAHQKGYETVDSLNRHFLVCGA